MRRSRNEWTDMGEMNEELCKMRWLRRQYQDARNGVVRVRAIAIFNNFRIIILNNNMKYSLYNFSPAWVLLETVYEWTCISWTMMVGATQWTNEFKLFDHHSIFVSLLCNAQQSKQHQIVLPCVWSPDVFQSHLFSLLLYYLWFACPLTCEEFHFQYAWSEWINV